MAKAMRDSIPIPLHLQQLTVLVSRDHAEIGGLIEYVTTRSDSII